MPPTGGNTEGEGLPPLEVWSTLAWNGSDDAANDFIRLQRVEYGDAEQEAETLYFETNDDNEARLFGGPSFFYFPSSSWQVGFCRLLTLNTRRKA